MKSICLSDLNESVKEKWDGWLSTRSIGCAEYDPDLNVIRLSVYPNGNDYEVDLDRCLTAVQFTDWVFHLAGKTWCKDSVLTDFVLCMRMAIEERHGKSATSFFNVGGAAQMRP